MFPRTWKRCRKYRVKSASVPSHVEWPVMSRRIRTSGSWSAAFSPSRRNDAGRKAAARLVGGAGAARVAIWAAAFRAISPARITSSRVTTNGVSRQDSRNASMRSTGSRCVRRNSIASGSSNVPRLLTNAKSSSRIPGAIAVSPSKNLRRVADTSDGKSGQGDDRAAKSVSRLAGRIERGPNHRDDGEPRPASGVDPQPTDSGHREASTARRSSRGSHRGEPEQAGGVRRRRELRGLVAPRGHHGGDRVRRFGGGDRLRRREHPCLKGLGSPAAPRAREMARIVLGFDPRAVRALEPNRGISVGRRDVRRRIFPGDTTRIADRDGGRPGGWCRRPHLRRRLRRLSGVATGGGIAEKYGAGDAGRATARVGGRNRSISPRKFLHATITYQAKNPAPAIASPRNTRFRKRRNASPPKPS